MTGRGSWVDPLPVIAMGTSQNNSRQTIQANSAAMQIHRIKKNSIRRAIWSVARIRYTKANGINTAVNSSEVPMALSATMAATIHAISLMFYNSTIFATKNG